MMVVDNYGSPPSCSPHIDNKSTYSTNQYTYQQLKPFKWLTFRNGKSYCHTLRFFQPSLCNLKVTYKRNHDPPPGTLALTGSRTSDPFPFPSQFLQRSISTSWIMREPIHYLSAAVSAKGMLGVVGTHKDLGMIVFFQIVKTLFVAPTRGMSL